MGSHFSHLSKQLTPSCPPPLLDALSFGVPINVWTFHLGLFLQPVAVKAAPRHCALCMFSCSLTKFTDRAWWFKSSRVVKVLVRRVCTASDNNGQASWHWHDSLTASHCPCHHWINVSVQIASGTEETHSSYQLESLLQHRRMTILLSKNSIASTELAPSVRPTASLTPG